MKKILYIDMDNVLVDDRPNNSAKDFKGEWIPFNPKDNPNPRFLDWNSVMEYLRQKV